MAIEIRCECGARYRVPDNTAGRKVRCKHCEALVPVPVQQTPVEVQVEVIEEEAAVVEEPIQDVEERARPKKEKKEKKKKRRDMSKEERWQSLEERLASRDRGSWRRNEVRRGWKFVITGLGVIAVGVMLTVCLYILATGDPGHVATDYGIASVAYKIAGIWGPLIVCGIGGLVPIGLGIMNFMGVGIVVEDPDK